MHVARPLPTEDLLYLFPSFVKIAAVNEELGSQCLHGIVFLSAVSLGNRHRAGHTVEFRGQGNGLAMISPRGSDHAPASLFRA